MARSETVSTAEDLHLWRFNNKLSMAEAAAFLAVSAKTVSNWEAGRYPRDLFRRLQEAEVKRAASSGQGFTPAGEARQSKAALKQAKDAAWAYWKAQFAAYEEARKALNKNCENFGQLGTVAELRDRVVRECLDLYGVSPFTE